MRIPIGVNLESRDGTVAKDAKVTNGIVEIDGDLKKLRKRPGCSDYGLVKTGVAQLLVYWNGIKSIIGDYFCSGISTTPTTYPAAVWNAADKDASITLSGGDLTVTSTSFTDGLVRSTTSVSSGYWRYQVTLDSGAGTQTREIGFANSSAPVDDDVGKTNNGIAYYVDSGQIVKNDVVIASVAICSNGDVIDVVLDATLVTISFYRNGALVYTATGADVPSGALFACVGYSSGSGSHVMTANFGGSAFTHTITTLIATNLSPTTASLPFSAQDSGSNAPTDYLMFKNATQAWTLKPSGTPTLITDADYPGISTVSVTSITRSGSVVTATTPADTNFQVGSAVTIAGATPSDYNGTQTVTGVTPSSFRPAVEIPITITRVGTTATATSTTQPHGFINGQVVPIRGADQVEYNGDKTITWISATQFSFTVTQTGTDLTSPAGGTPAISLYPLQILLVNTGTNSWLGSYIKTYDYGYLQNGNTFTSPIGNIGTCTVSSPAEASFVITSTTSTFPLNATLNMTVYLTQPAVSSITSAYNVCTVTTSTSHNFRTGKPITIVAATPTEYNVTSAPIQVTGATTFRYTIPSQFLSTPASPATGTIIAGDAALVTGASFTYSIATTPVTPATGTITATGGRNTVPGIVYLNGYFLVMDVAGVIYNSALDDPTSWGALDFIAAQNEPGEGVAIAKTLNYAVAFKEWSTEFFYDAQNATGSPLSPVDNGFTLVGCASGTSVAGVDGNLMWLAQVKQRGRSVYIMSGTQQSKVSTPDIDRILNADDLATVHAYGLKISGHSLYVLTLVTSNITLVFDLNSKHWYQWSSLTLGANKSVTSITLSGTTATVTCAVAHTLNDGDPVLISGSNQAGYNGIWQAQYVSSTVFTIQVAAGLTTPATGTIIANPYTESYFKFTKYANCDGVDLMLHESNGHLYNLLQTEFRDAGIPINRSVRSQKLDGNTTNRKKIGRITLISDTVSDTAMVRWSDDDYATNRPFRVLDMSQHKPMVRRCGAFFERSIEYKHIGNTAPVWDAIELEVTK